jgi:hypothetical protein
VTRVGLSSHHSWFPVVSWEEASCPGRILRFFRVILHGETGLRMYSHSRETVVDPRSKLCYFNCRRSKENNNKRAPPMGFNGWIFYFIFYPDSIFFN